MTSSKLLSLLAVGSLFAAVCSAAVGCAPPAPSDDEPTTETDEHLLGGTRLTPTDVAAQLRSAGFPANTIGKMVCTAKYESSYYEQATNHNKNGSTDYGLFQINSIHLGTMAGCPSSSSALFDPATNAKCALAIYNAQGINAWYGYQKHKTECDKTMAPGSTATTSSSGSTSGSSGASTSGSVSSTSGSTSTSGSSYSSSGATSGSASTSTGDDDDDDSTGATIDPNQDYDLGGGCWSATLGDMMDPLSCVQSKGDNGEWEQCKDGKWYQASDVEGPYGYCNGTFPLGSTSGSSSATTDDDDDSSYAH